MKMLDAEIVAFQDGYHSQFRDKRRWIIVQDDSGFIVHVWTVDGVAPPTTYPTKRLAAARVLQLMGLGPVAPQDHPEEVCIGSVELGDGDSEGR